MPRQHSVKTEALSKTETDDIPLRMTSPDGYVRISEHFFSAGRSWLNVFCKDRGQATETGAHVLMTEQINDMQRQRTFNEQYDYFCCVVIAIEHTSLKKW